jgi:hypothetical protein
MADDPQPRLEPITPTVVDVSGTVRVTFPFDRDTASAVFRPATPCGLLFDTPSPILNPEQSDALASIAKGFTIIPSGNTQIVRMDLAVDRLATLASEGRSWVLSIGDILLGAAEPLMLSRERDKNGRFQMNGAARKAGTVHSFNDPDVGDTLSVVTVFPAGAGPRRVTLPSSISRRCDRPTGWWCDRKRWAASGSRRPIWRASRSMAADAFGSR